MFSLMIAYLLNVILTFWFGFPGIGQLIGWASNGSGSQNLSLIQLSLYGLAVIAALVYSAKNRNIDLTKDAETLSNLNATLIRMAFWVVLLVGVVDVTLSFLRVEGLLETFGGKQLASDLGRAKYRGIYVHTPVIIIGILLGLVTRTLGFAWLALMVVAAELIIVFSRFIFSYEQAFMADLVRFWYGALFLFSSAYTLLDDGHVRVDLVYAGMRKKGQGRVNSFGAIILGIPLCWTILWVGMWSKSSVIISPVLVFEITQSGFGMYVKYFMAGFLGIFAVTMMIQFISQLFSSFYQIQNGVDEKMDDPLQVEAF